MCDSVSKRKSTEIYFHSFRDLGNCHVEPWETIVDRPFLQLLNKDRRWNPQVHTAKNPLPAWKLHLGNERSCKAGQTWASSCSDFAWKRDRANPEVLTVRVGADSREQPSPQETRHSYDHLKGEGQRDSEQQHFRQNPEGFRSVGQEEPLNSPSGQSRRR